MKKELHIFLTAMLFFTRIPCPKWVDHHPDYLRLSVKYFSLVGIIIGSIAGIVFWGAAFVFSKEIAILLSMCSTLYATGAFHEDGLADVCDGFGGGWTKDNILKIMKDSRLGTYGTIGLLMTLALKFSALYTLDTTILPFVCIAGHSSSRFIATTLLFTHPYAQDTSQSKVKPAAKQVSIAIVGVCGIFGILPLLLLGNPLFLLTLLPMYMIKLFLGVKFTKWIGGQTGDCAGAVQQLSELVFYVTLSALWNSI